VIFNGSNSYSGILTIGTTNNYFYPSNMNFKVGSAYTVPYASGIAFGSNSSGSTSTLDLNGISINLGVLTGGTNAYITSTAAGSPTVTVGLSNASSTYGGIIQNGSGTVALAKTGTGTFTLSGNNTYTGGTFVNAGTLLDDLSARSATFSLYSNTIASGAVMILSNTTTGIDAAGTIMSNTVVGGAGTLVKTGAGYLDFWTGSSLSNFTGLIDVQSGTLAVNGIGAGATMTNAVLNIASGASFDDLRKYARALRTRGVSLGDRQPAVRDAIKAYLDAEVGTDGGPVDDAAAEKWAKAYATVSAAAEAATK
jgi:autotransporter-associated beta strand protein